MSRHIHLKLGGIVATLAMVCLAGYATAEPPPAERVDQAASRASQRALAKHILEGKPDPARVALLRQYIAAEQSGEIPTEILSPRFLPLVSDAWPTIREDNQRLGKLKSLKFRRVTVRGADMYAAEYEQGNMVWLVGPLTTDRKLVAVTRASGAAAESLEKIEGLRVRLMRAEQQLAEAGGPARPSERPMLSIEDLLREEAMRKVARTAEVVLVDARKEFRLSKREQLTDARDQIFTALRKEEAKLREGVVTILPEEPVPPPLAAKPSTP